MNKKNKKGGSLIWGIALIGFLFIMTAILTDMGMIMLNKVNLKMAGDIATIGASNYGKEGSKYIYKEYNLDANGNIIGQGKVTSTHEIVKINEEKAKTKGKELFEKNTSKNIFISESQIDGGIKVSNKSDESGGSVVINASSKPTIFFKGLTEVFSGNRMTVSAKAEVKKGR